MQQTQKIKKFPLILALALMTFILQSTNFFLNFYDSQQNAYRAYLDTTRLESRLLDFALTHKFDDLDRYLLQAVTGFSLIAPTLGRESIPATAPPTQSLVESEVNPVYIPNPTVYIYNTHNTETIAGTATGPLEAIPGDIFVTELSQIMGDRFQEHGIGTIVEGRLTQDIVELRDWHYSRSYEVSREILKSSWDANPSLNFFFDLHRDATTGEEATLTLNGKEYAVLKIIIGSDNPVFSENLAFANEILTVMDERYPGLMFPSSLNLSGGYGKNGIYNQDLSPNALLFEIGGQDTSLEAATNSLNALADVLVEIMNRREN